MEDPYASFIDNCNYSSSQEDLLHHTLHAREDQPFPDLDFPEPYPPPPSTTDDVFAGGGIVICSPPETPPSDPIATPSAEDFRTPPEDSRRSSSEEPPPPQVLCSRLRDPRARDGRTPDLASSQEKNRSSKMVEVLSSGKSRAGEVSMADRESSMVGDKRRSEKRSPIQESSQLKRIRVSGKSINTPNLETREKHSPILVSDKLINAPNPRSRERPSPIQESPLSKRVRASGQLIDTPNVETREKQSPNQEQSHSRVSSKLINTPIPEAGEDGVCLVKRRIGFQVEMEVVDVEAEEVDTVVIEDTDENSCEDVVGISSLQQPHDIEEEEEMEGGNGDRDTEGHPTKDVSRQGRRELPSWARRKEDNREVDDNRVNTERAVDGDKDVVLQMLALLAREAGPSHGTGDFLETVKQRGLTFPEPKWWHGDDEHNGL